VEQVSSLKTGVKYKDTPIGKIPVDWEVARLSEIAIKEKNAIVDGDWIEIKDQSSSGYRLLQVGNIGVGHLNLGGNFRYVSEETINRLNCTVLQKGCLLISRMPDPIGRACLMEDLDYKCITVVDCTIVELDPQKVDSLFVVFSLNSQPSLNRAKILATGTTRQRISRRQLEAVPVIVPPLPEQKSIAEILTAMDYAIGKTTQIIDKTKELKKGLMQSLLTRGIEHNKFKKTEIGEIPDEWDVKRLIDLAGNEKYTFTGGPFGSDLKENCYTDHGIRIIQLQNIGDGEFLDDYKIFTSEEKANELRSCNIYPGDIIIAKMADPVARACIIPDMDKRYLMASDGIRLSINEKENDTNFVLYAINSTYFRKNAEKYSTGTTRLRIGLTELRNLPIGIPSLKEQKKIADILSSIDDEIKKESNHKEQLETLKKGLMQVLLTGKLRVAV